MPILSVNVDTMSVTICDSKECMEPSLVCRQLLLNLLVWEDTDRVSKDRVLRIGRDEFRGNVFLTDALGATPDFTQVPKLRFYEPGLIHVSTISLSANGTAWIMCDCDDRCGKCSDIL